MRKSFLVLLLLLVAPALAGAQIQHIQSSGISATGAVAEIGQVFENPVTAGNAITVGVACWDTGSCDTATGYSDDQANTYGNTVRTGSVSLARAVNVAGGSTIVTFTPAFPAFVGFGISEFSGMHSDPNDGANSSIVFSGTTPETGSITTTAPGLLYAALSFRDGATTITEEGGWTVVNEDETFACCPHSVVFKIETIPGSKSHAWTTSAACDELGCHGAIMGLKQATAAPRRVRRTIIEQ